MKYYATALIAATASGQFNPPVDPDAYHCCDQIPRDPRCVACPDMAGINGISALDVVDLIDGVLIGALKVEHVDNLETCITDISPLVTHMTTAVEDFEDGSYHKIASGINELGEFFSQVSTTMEDCDKIGSDDVAKLKNMGEAFLHPKKLMITSAKNVLLNGVQIYNDIKAADYDLNSG